MLIIPKQNLFNIKNMGDVKKLKDMLGNFFTDTPLEKKAPMLDMAKDFIILYDKYISIEVEGLNCNLFKLIREKQKA